MLHAASSVLDGQERKTSGRIVVTCQLDVASSLSLTNNSGGARDLAVVSCCSLDLEQHL